MVVQWVNAFMAPLLTLFVGNLVTLAVLIFLKERMEQLEYSFPLTERAKLRLRIPGRSTFHKNAVAELQFHFEDKTQGAMRFSWSLVRRLAGLFPGPESTEVYFLYINESDVDLFLIDLKKSGKGNEPIPDQWNSPLLYSGFAFRKLRTTEREALLEKIRVMPQSELQNWFLPILDFGNMKAWPTRGQVAQWMNLASVDDDFVENGSAFADLLKRKRT